MARYSLEVVLDMRRDARERALAMLAAERRALAAEEEALADAERQRDAILEKRRSAITNLTGSGRSTLSDLHARRRYVEDLDAKIQEAEATIEEQLDRVARAEASVERARQNLIEAEAELKTLEKHKEKWLHEIRVEEERKSEREQDELAQIIYRRSRT